MTENKRNYTSFTTPLGVVGFNSLSKADQNGNFTITLYLPKNSQTESFMGELNSIVNSNFEFVKSQGSASTFVNVLDKGFTEKDLYQADTHYKLLFRSKTSPAIADSSGQTIQFTGFIPSGSTVRVRATAASYDYAGKAGTTFYLDGVQISKLSGEALGAKAVKFDAVDGDFVGVGSNTTDIGLD